MEITYLGLFGIILASGIVYKAITVGVQLLLGPKAPIGGPVGPKPTIADLLAELNLLIKLEVIAIIEVPQSVKDIPLITDFNKYQIEITQNVLLSLSTGFFKHANRCGLKRDYIVRYVTRTVQAEVMDFMQKHNYSMKSDRTQIVNNPLNKIGG